MKKTNINLLSFLAAILLCGLFYAVVAASFKSTGIYEFFYSRGAYQPLSLTFFLFGIFLVAARWRSFRSETATSGVAVPQGVISREDARRLASGIQAAHAFDLLATRISNLLFGHARGEELSALEERLKAKDRAELDQSVSLIGWVRSLPPLIGLLGTLDGLRGGIAEISQINNANDLDALRGRLQLFAQHASTAFDTTLLGISAAAILSALVFLVRRSEDDYLARVDEVADDLVRRFHHSSDVESALGQAVNNMIRQLSTELHALISGAAAPMVEAFEKQLQTGMGTAMQNWTLAWREELNRATERVFDGIERSNQRTAAILQQSFQSSVNQMSGSVAALEHAIAAPRGLQIRIAQDGMVEAGGNGR